MEIITERAGGNPDVPVMMYTLKNKAGSKLLLSSYGASAMGLYVPDRNGTIENVMVSANNWEDLARYRPFYGSTVGPVAGRIQDATFEWQGRPVFLEKNEGNNHLHGGSKGFDTLNWRSDSRVEEGQATVSFYLTRTERETGYPGKIRIQVDHTFTENNEWRITYRAESDQDTVINPTNHAYFNLSGAGKWIGDHTLQIKSSEFMELAEGNLPTGRILDTEKTPFDFRKSKKIKVALEETHPQIQLAGGLDHAFLLDDPLGISCVMLAEADSGRKMKMTTDRPAVVVYTHNHRMDELGRSPFCGIAFETQAVPNAINMEAFRETVYLKKSVPFKSTTEYRFFEGCTAK